LVWAWVLRWIAVVGLEAKELEGGEQVAHVSPPICGEGQESGDEFEDGPADMRRRTVKRVKWGGLMRDA
jgi:hypothetical protein